MIQCVIGNRVELFVSERVQGRTYDTLMPTLIRRLHDERFGAGTVGYAAARPYTGERASNKVKNNVEWAGLWKVNGEPAFFHKNDRAKMMAGWGRSVNWYKTR